MEKYVIVDLTSNTGKIYITFTGENTELLENTKVFDSLEDCQKCINSVDWNNWAKPKKLKDC